MTVATAFAVSWNPLANSKASTRAKHSASATMAAVEPGWKCIIGGSPAVSPPLKARRRRRCTTDTKV